MTAADAVNLDTDGGHRIRGGRLVGTRAAQGPWCKGKTMLMCATAQARVPSGICDSTAGPLGEGPRRTVACRSDVQCRTAPRRGLVALRPTKHLGLRGYHHLRNG